MHNALRAVLSALILVLAACTPRIEPRAPTAAAPSELEVAQRIFDQITALHVSGLPNDSQMQVLAPLLTVELRQALDAARAQPILSGLQDHGTRRGRRSQRAAPLAGAFAGRCVRPIPDPRCRDHGRPGCSHPPRRRAGRDRPGARRRADALDRHHRPRRGLAGRLSRGAAALRFRLGALPHQLRAVRQPGLPC